MASFAATRPVNPPGVELVLTEEQVWKALEYKARNPALFVKAITSAEVVKDEGNKVSTYPTFRMKKARPIIDASYSQKGN